VTCGSWSRSFDGLCRRAASGRWSQFLEYSSYCYARFIIISGGLHLRQPRHTRRSEIMRALVERSIPTAGAMKQHLVLPMDAISERCRKMSAWLSGPGKSRKSSYTACRVRAGQMNVGCRTLARICGNTENSCCFRCDCQKK